MADIILHFDAILFDMDGTLVDSTAGVVGAWNLFRKSYPSIDVDNILSSAHGVRTVDNLRKFCGIEDPEILEARFSLPCPSPSAESIRFEKAIVSSSTEQGGQGIVLLPGVSAVMQEIAAGRFLPNPCWAICTSATREYASSALASAGVPVPDVFVASEDVEKGKPFPDPYLLGAQKCGVDPSNCVVFEDAPNGVISGREAGCKTIALLTSHSLEQIKASKPDYIIKDLSDVSVKRTDTGVTVAIKALRG
ncbi:HAD-like protein [Agrocybe pediades]|nr:HAD-like protein [Agrocybe pediades]